MTDSSESSAVTNLRLPGRCVLKQNRLAHPEMSSVTRLSPKCCWMRYLCCLVIALSVNLTLTEECDTSPNPPYSSPDHNACSDRGTDVLESDDLQPSDCSVSNNIYQQATRPDFHLMSRGISKLVPSREKDEGVGARVRRSIGNQELRNLDPFLMLDEFRVAKPAGFPDHPHRGFETVGGHMVQGCQNNMRTDEINHWTLNDGINFYPFNPRGLCRCKGVQTV